MSDIEHDRLSKHGKRINLNEILSLKLRTDLKDQSIKTIKIIKRCYDFAWGVEIIQRVNIQKSQRLKMGKSCYYPDVLCVEIKN